MENKGNVKMPSVFNVPTLERMGNAVFDTLMMPVNMGNIDINLSKSQFIHC